MKLIWLPTALDDLEGITDYISDRNPDAAQRLKWLVEACAERLPEHPYLYRIGRLGGTREAVVHPNYILIYRVTVQSVEIVNVVHARQEYP